MNTELHKRRLLFTLAYFAPAALLVTLAAGLFIYGEQENFAELELYFTEEEGDFYHDTNIPEEAQVFFTKEELETFSMKGIDERLTQNNFDPLFAKEKDSPFYRLSEEQIDVLIEEDALDNIFDLPETISEQEFITARDTIIARTISFVLITWFFALIIFGLLAHWLSGRVIAPLAEALEKQKHFVSDAAHELRTPLALIKTDADVLARDKNANSEEYKSFRTRTVESVEYLSTLTTKLLNLTKLEYTTQATQKPLALNNITTTTTQRFQKNAAQKEIALAINTEDNVSAIIAEDDYIQLLTIMLDNAFKYTPHSGKITLTLAHKRKNTYISICNTGAKIADEDLTKIFDRFYRADESRTNESHGLGLAIAKEIVQNASGTITAENIANGVCFSVTLPRT